MNIPNAQFVRSIDGDTIVVNLPGENVIFGYNISVRLAGIQCPEIRTNDKAEFHKGMVAKGFTQRWCERRQTLQLHNVKRGKYFRLIADVWDGKEYLNITLLRKELAVKSKP